MKTYRVEDGAPQDVRTALAPYSALLQDLLYQRGITEASAAADFLAPDYDRDSHDPFLLPDLEKAVDRILRAVETKEKVCVWSDYDCDGIPGGVLLAEFLRSIGLSVRHYIPDRHGEGYGLNSNGLDSVAADGITLVITVDLGISDAVKVAYANSLGMEVIVTDHHIVPVGGETESEEEAAPGGEKSGLPKEGDPRTFRKQALPPAYAVINPKRLDNTYPFDGLCGAGVAWKLVQGILKKNRFHFSEGQEKWMLDLAGISTLSDMVPLRGENRMIARFGLMVLRRNRRPGFAALLSAMRIEPNTLSEDDVGFMIAPRINAASRMDSPLLAARLLATSSAAEAKDLAAQLDGINTERKTIVAGITKEVNKRLADLDMADSPIIVMGNPNWRPGVLGLVANSLMQAHGKIVFLWGRDGGGELMRGSCRSDGSINVVELMREVGDVLAGFGGHTAAGGFSVLQDRIHELAPRLTEVCKKMVTGAVVEQVIAVDRRLELAEVAFAHRDLAQMAPFGMQNAKPLFIFPQVKIASVRVFGKKTDHLELGLERDGVKISGIAFFSTPESFQKVAVEGMLADIVGHVETDWRGNPRIRVVDVI